MTTRVEEEGLEARRRELEEGRRRTEDVTWSKVPFPCPCHDQPRLLRSGSTTLAMDDVDIRTHR